MDQLKRLFVNGCSFLTHRHTHEANINFSTAELIKEHGGFEEMVNFARGGRGNDRILSTTITYFEKYPEYKRNTFVLIGWSSALRLDYPTAIEFKPLPPLDECWATIKMAHNADHLNKSAGLKQPIDHHSWEVHRYYQNVIGLQNYLKINNIRFVMYNSLQPALSYYKQDHQALGSAIDRKHFMDIEQCQNLFCQHKGLCISAHDTHPNEQGHKTWADKVKKFIDQNQLYIQQGPTNEI
jgi:hypothetical protein